MSRHYLSRLPCRPLLESLEERLTPGGGGNPNGAQQPMVVNHFYTTTVNTPVGNIQILQGDTPSDPVAGFLVGAVGPQSQRGGFVFLQVPVVAVGVYVYVPPRNFSGLDVFDYHVQDYGTGQQLSAQVFITVVDSPRGQTVDGPPNPPVFN